MLGGWATRGAPQADPGVPYTSSPPGHQPLPHEQWPHQPYPIYQQVGQPDWGHHPHPAQAYSAQHPYGAVPPQDDSWASSRRMWMIICSALVAAVAGAAFLAASPSASTVMLDSMKAVVSRLRAPSSSSGRTSDDYDCEVGFSSWQESWTVPQQEWCCREYGRGCPAQVAAGIDCETGYNSLADYAEGWTAGQREYCCLTFSRMCPRPRVMSFYAYRAQGDSLYPMENVNMADLPGVMWYLQNEVVVSTPRKYNITRILRYKVTMENTEEHYVATKRQFGPFVAFDAAMCTVPNCDNIWLKYGFVVGCQTLNVSMQNYVPFSQNGCIPPHCKSGSWYSFPGPCPSKHFDNKSHTCTSMMPGGACGMGQPWGQTCTYMTEPAGEIRLDDLVGIGNYTKFLHSRSFEYNATSDRGKNFSWWDGRHDQVNCTWRMTQVKEMFETYFPTADPTLRDSEPPPCWA